MLTDTLHMEGEMLTVDATKAGCELYPSTFIEGWMENVVERITSTLRGLWHKAHWRIWRRFTRAAASASAFENHVTPPSLLKVPRPGLRPELFLCWVGQQTANRWGWVVLTGSRCLLDIKTDALLIFSSLSCRLCRGTVPTVPEAHQTDQTRPGKLREAERRMVRGMNPTWLVVYCWVMMENSTSHLRLQQRAGSSSPVPFLRPVLSICLPKPQWLDGMVFPFPLSREEAIMTRTWSICPSGLFAPIFS